MSSTVICRLCLNTNRRSYFINHTVLQETWERLTDATFHSKDGRPLLACYICCAQLRNSYQLRKRALKAEELFTKYIPNNGFEDSKKVISLMVSNNYNNDYNYAIEEQHNLDSGQKVPERVEEVKKEIEDDEVINIKEEDGNTFFYLDEAVPEQEEDLVVDTISIKEEIEDVKEEISLESDMHDTVKETQADYEDPLRKRSCEEITQSDVTVVTERINTGVTAKKWHAEDLRQTARQTEVHEAIMEKEQQKNAITNLPKEINITINENISNNIHVTAGNGSFNNNTNSKVFSCELCEYECFTKTSFNAHLSIHTGDKPYKCDFCEFRTLEKGNLKTHLMFKHTKEKNYKCHLCQKNFVTKFDLNRHQWVHTGEKPYKCDLCDYKTSDSRSLKGHLMLTHKKEKNYECDICKKKFTIKKYLQGHLHLHSGDKPYKCDFCEYRTWKKGNLDNHLKFKHIKEKHFKCNTCQKNFVTNADLKRHQRVHTGEKPYKCDFCEYRASVSGSLKRHLLIKHIKEKNYECDICQKNFTTKNQLNKHRRIHTGEKPYKCDFCEYRSLQKGNLKTHLKLKHKGKIL